MQSPKMLCSTDFNGLWLMRIKTTQRKRTLHQFQNISIVSAGRRTCALFPKWRTALDGGCVGCNYITTLRCVMRSCGSIERDAGIIPHAGDGALSRSVHKAHIVWTSAFHSGASTIAIWPQKWAERYSGALLAPDNTWWQMRETAVFNTQGLPEPLVS